MKLLEAISKLPDRKRGWASISITFVIASALIVFGIYGIGQYGIAMFVLTPLFVGFCSTVLYGYKNKISISSAFGIAGKTLFVIIFALLFFAIEGAICIFMAAPIGLALALIGSAMGHMLVSKVPTTTTTVLVTLGLFIPLTSFGENKISEGENNIISVTTSIKINAGQEVVWKNVVEFPQLNAPTEFLFKAGIASPINATIQGKGKGAIRYCNFTTGSFIEPITQWDEPNLLSFNVKQSPQPMKELSFWDINAPHLHDYFVSKKGQFKLIKISENETLLEGATWYSNKIKPSFY